MKCKTLIAALCLCFCALGDRRDQYLQKQIDLTKNTPSKENIFSLMDLVTNNLSHPSLISQQEMELTNIALQEIVLLPNHAEFFAEELRKEQSKVSHLPVKPSGERNRYDQIRHKYLLRTLSLLRSPETIKVLGEFLHDDKDWPGDFAPGDYHANNGYAMRALKVIGLRNPPENNLQDESFKCLRKWISWHEKVKAGEITFSFEGQPLEYRFKPDGTWVTIPLPQSSDSKKPDANEAIPETQTSSQHDAQENNTSRSPWIYAGVAFLILLITFTARKMITGRSAITHP